MGIEKNQIWMARLQVFKVIKRNPATRIKPKKINSVLCQITKNIINLNTKKRTTQKLMVIKSKRAAKEKSPLKKCLKTRHRMMFPPMNWAIIQAQVFKIQTLGKKKLVAITKVELIPGRLINLSILSPAGVYPWIWQFYIQTKYFFSKRSWEHKLKKECKSMDFTTKRAKNENKE